MKNPKIKNRTIGSLHFAIFTVLLCLLPFVLPAGIQAKGEVQVLTQQEVEAALRRYVLQRSTWRPEQVEVSTRAYKPLTLPAGKVELRIIRPQRGITPGFHSFLLDVGVKGKGWKKVWVRTEVRVSGEVVVTSRPLARYQFITKEDVRLELRNLTSLSKRAFTKLGETIGKQAIRPIEVNEILTPMIAELPKVVRRGSLLSLVYETAGLKVESRGKAMEDGRVGEIIRVKNSSSGKALEGRILDARTVRMN